MSIFSKIWSIFVEFYNCFFPTWLERISIQKSNSLFGWSLWNADQTDGWSSALKAADEHGKLFQAYLIGQRRVYVNDKYIAKFVAENVQDKRYFHLGDVPVSRRQILNMRTNAECKKIRSILGHAFSPSSMRSVQSRISAISKKAVARFEEACDGQTVVLMDQLFSELTIDVILTVGFEMEIGALDRTKEFVELDKSIKARLGLMFMGVVPFRGILKHFFPKLKVYEDSTDVINNLCEDIYLALRKQDQEGKLPANSIGKSILKLVDEVGKTKEQVIGEIFVLFTAGHETTAHTLSWFFYSMALHPEVQQKCFEDMRRQKTADIAEPVNQLTPLPPYIEACFRESMRLYPAAATQFGGRFNWTDSLTIPLEVLNKQDPSVPPPRNWVPYTEPLVIPAKTNISINSYALHRSKCNWGEAAEEFIPERWMPGFDFQGRPVDKESVSSNRLASEGVFTGGGSKVDELMFTPFAHGARNCIGMNLALVEARTVIADLMQRYEFTLADPEKFSHEENVMQLTVLLKPADKLPMLVKRRL